eukprot:IDg17362t1
MMTSALIYRLFESNSINTKSKITGSIKSSGNIQSSMEVIGGSCIVNAFAISKKARKLTSNLEIHDSCNVQCNMLKIPKRTKIIDSVIHSKVCNECKFKVFIQRSANTLVTEFINIHSDDSGVLGNIVSTGKTTEGSEVKIEGSLSANILCVGGSSSAIIGLDSYLVKNIVKIKGNGSEAKISLEKFGNSFVKTTIMSQFVGEILEEEKAFDRFRIAAKLFGTKMKCNAIIK